MPSDNILFPALAHAMNWTPAYFLPFMRLDASRIHDSRPKMTAIITGLYSRFKGLTSIQSRTEVRQVSITDARLCKLYPRTGHAPRSTTYGPASLNHHHPYRAPTTPYHISFQHTMCQLARHKKHRSLFFHQRLLARIMVTLMLFQYTRRREVSQYSQSSKRVRHPAINNEPIIIYLATLGSLRTRSSHRAKA